MATDRVKVKDRKAKTATAKATTPKRTSQVAEQAKRKATDDASPTTVKKRKAAEKPTAPAKSPAKSAKDAKAVKTMTTENTDKANKSTKEEVPKKSKAKKVIDTKTTEAVEEAEAQDAEIAVEDDATTKALVQEIDSEVEEDEEDDDDDEAGGVSLFRSGQDVGKAPAAGVEKAAQKSGAKAKDDGAAKPGVIVYVGRIPHGFFEREMRSYFSQFGDIRRLRLSRNRRTGASKHYAFVEFADAEVAAVVAATMDNYLLFGHLLRCSVVSPERVPESLFKGAGRRFKAVPWNQMAGRRLALPRTETGWSDKIGREAKKRATRAARLAQTIGYAYEPAALKAAEAAEAEAKVKDEAETETETKAQAVEDATLTETVAPTAVTVEKAVAEETATKTRKSKRNKSKGTQIKA